MTYGQAENWLGKIGGEQIAATETWKFGWVIIRVQSATKGEVVRRARYDASLIGYEQEAAVRAAFVRACDDLRDALA